MPTPRHVTEIAKQVRARGLSSAAAGTNAWVSGIVVSSVGDMSPDYQVNLEGAGGIHATTVAATSVIDAPIKAGDFVWVIPVDGGGHLIAGLQ